MELRVKINDNFFDELKNLTGVSNTTQLANEAFVFLRWAANESRKGRIIVSENEDGSDEKQVVMPSLEHARSLTD
ncbi:MAG: hypothetical protein EOP49_43095 [Sphingobacteriales bacterium]|nr:MAG: hypothetical protein EOP49_43095 [Sphingobacteriales bacterium]